MMMSRWEIGAGMRISAWSENEKGVTVYNGTTLRVTFPFIHVDLGAEYTGHHIVFDER